MKTFNRLGLAIVCAAALSAMGAACASADTIYAYTGNAFDTFSSPTTSYTANDKVTGWFDLTTPLVASSSTLQSPTPVSFSFTDGIQTFTNATTLFMETFNVISTDATGLPLTWSIALRINSADFIITTTECLGNPCAAFAFTDLGRISTSNFGYNSTMAGDWTVTATPIPTTLPLFATGLGALGLLGWRRKRKAQATA